MPDTLQYSHLCLHGAIIALLSVDLYHAKDITAIETKIEGSKQHPCVTSQPSSAIEQPKRYDNQHYSHDQQSEHHHHFHKYDDSGVYSVTYAIYSRQYIMLSYQDIVVLMAYIALVNVVKP